MSRVCKYNCNFCQPGPKQLFGYKERFKSPENVIDELLHIKKNQGLNSFMILDDNAFQNRKWLEGFIKCLEEHKDQINAKFFMAGRSDNICKNKDLIPKLKELGLTLVSVGFESASNNVLKILRKGTSSELNYMAAKILNDNNVKIQANMIFGVVGETKEDINLSVDFIKRIKPYIGGRCINTLSSTYLYKEYKKGIIIQ